jgi:glucan phosphoethanolaminetransferase (alkaline phosphatase superfamily)
MICINWKYMTRMVVGFTAYALGLVALNYFYTEHSPHRYWLVLLLVMPILYVAITIIRYVSELDEMWRKIVTEAMAFSGVAAGFTCFSYLFLRDMGAREFHGEWAFYIAWVYYWIGPFFS